MKKFPLKERFLYWFDNQMAKGTVSLIKLLTFGTVAVILLISGIGIVMGLAENGRFAFLWDSMATIINVELPYYEDSAGKIIYLVLMTFATVFGLLVTSVLIGIISSGIEEKINELRHGHSRILESGHTVVLGFTPGEYTLIEQLILGKNREKACIVIASDMPQEEMSALIYDNVDIPKNIRVICRTVDLFDPISLGCCSISTCKNVIISPTDDKRTVKMLLAVSNIINDADSEHVQVDAIISTPEYRFPESVAAKHNVTALQTSDIISRIIAHSCTQSGLSDTFREIFNFENAELYAVSAPKAVGLTFAELMRSLDEAVPVGFIRDEYTRINPSPAEIIRDDDRLILFMEDRGSYRFTPVGEPDIDESKSVYPQKLMPAGLVAFLGYNDSFETVLQELPENVSDIMVECKKKYRDTVRKIASDRQDLHITIYDKDINTDGALLEMAKGASHIVLLSDGDLSDEDADLKSIFRIMNLRDIRTRYCLQFNITAEMRRESNKKLIAEDDHIDFVVASNMSSLILAQLSENPQLTEAFREILSNIGNEFFLYPTPNLHCIGTRSVRYWRQHVLRQGYILIGYIKDGQNVSVFNPPLNATVEFGPYDQLIVIGQS